MELALEEDLGVGGLLHLWSCRKVGRLGGDSISMPQVCFHDYHLGRGEEVMGQHRLFRDGGEERL
jgi:hypothetical protein